MLDGKLLRVPDQRGILPFRLQPVIPNLAKADTVAASAHSHSRSGPAQLERADHSFLVQPSRKRERVRDLAMRAAGDRCPLSAFIATSGNAHRVLRSGSTAKVLHKPIDGRPGSTNG
ncbi:hypothetical protein [Bradyrhizobium sp. AZCC 2230]|uniref:hypothetical protein n=1 Tax=Bradyrhizobium sp. AZCC 2230 TaxID=3117021 RepID=UPI002FF16CFD